MGRMKVGMKVKLGPYGRAGDFCEKATIRDDLVGHSAIVVEILAEKDSRGCRQVIVETDDRYRIEWRICSLIFVQI